MLKTIYFHGGPGLNANPERALLPGPFAAAGLELVLWEEPSAQRSAGPQFRAEGAFEHALETAEQLVLREHRGAPLLLVGHSFGVHALAHVASRHPDKVAAAVMVAPDFSLPTSDVNMFRLAQREYQAAGDPRADAVAKVLERYSGRFDQNTIEGFILFSQNPALMQRYWANAERMAAFLGQYTPPAYSLDVQGFMAVRASFRPVEQVASRAPALACVGRHDVIIDREAELAEVRRRFQRVDVEEFGASAHYPHIEETERFLSVLTRWLDGLGVARG